MAAYDSLLDGLCHLAELADAASEVAARARQFPGLRRRPSNWLTSPVDEVLAFAPRPGDEDLAHDLGEWKGFSFGEGARTLPVELLKMREAIRLAERVSALYGPDLAPLADVTPKVAGTYLGEALTRWRQVARS